MAQNNSHIVVMPPWVSLVGIARLIIALIVLILVAVAAGIWYSADYAAFGLTLFTASATLIIVAYYCVSLMTKPNLYNPWAVLGLEIFGVVFWLVSFALCAEWTHAYNHDIYMGTGQTNYGFWNAPFRPEDIGLESRDLTKRATNNKKASIGLMGTAAGLGAVVFVLCVVVLVSFSIKLHKHRIAGKPTLPGGTVSTPAAAPEKPTIVTTSPRNSTASKGKEPGVTPQVEDKKAGTEPTKEVDVAAIV